MSHENHEVLSELESALASLRPPASQLQSGAERDRLIYLAGRASVETKAAPRRRLSVLAWPLATAAMALIALSLGALLLHERQIRYDLLAAAQRDPSKARRPAADSDRDAASPVREIPATIGSSRNPAGREAQGIAPLVSYLRLRGRVLREGVDALPAPTNREFETNYKSFTPRSSLEIFEG